MLEFGGNEVWLDSTLGEIVSFCRVASSCQVVMGFSVKSRTILPDRGGETASADKGGMVGLRNSGYSDSFGSSQMFPF